MEMIENLRVALSLARNEGGAGEAYSLEARLCHLTIDHASISNPSTLSTSYGHTFNIWALIAFLGNMGGGVSRKLVSVPFPIDFSWFAVHCRNVSHVAPCLDSTLLRFVGLL